MATMHLAGGIEGAFANDAFGIGPMAALSAQDYILVNCCNPRLLP